MVNTLLQMFSYGFMSRALAVGLLVSLCAALLGVCLVLKRYSMIGDGLSHVGFGTLSIAMALHLSPLFVSIPIMILAAFLLLRLSENSSLRGDAAIALVSSSALATGILVASLSGGMNADVHNYMFGSILAMSSGDVYLSVGLSLAVLVLFVCFYNNIFAVTFDEAFARATGTKVRLYNLLIALLTALTVVVGMRMMGSLLMSSLIIFPALTAMRLFKSFKAVVICAALTSLFSFLCGMVVSFLLSVPTGACIVLISLTLLLVFTLLEKGKKLF
ncbi:MAG: metal ABC transporter permease [Ruminococcaceae bacterium]|nr:metal ABC transporter permease [Oscillospiraceae bacterium]